MPWQRSEGRKCGSTILLLVSQQMMNVAAIWNSVVGVHSSSQYRGCSRGSVVNVSSSPRVQTVNFSLRSFLRRQCSADLQLLQHTLNLCRVFLRIQVVSVSGLLRTSSRPLAQARSRAVPQALRPAAIQASIARWSALLTQSAQVPFAASLTMQDPATHTGPDGEDIPLSTLLQHCPPTPPPQASRLPLRPWGSTPGIGLIPKSKWPGTWSAEAVRATPDPPPFRPSCGKKERPGKKKITHVGWLCGLVPRSFALWLAPLSHLSHSAGSALCLIQCLPITCRVMPSLVRVFVFVLVAQVVTIVSSTWRQWIEPRFARLAFLNDLDLDCRGVRQF